MVFMYLTVLVLASHMMLGDAVVTVSNLGASDLAGTVLGNRPDPYVKVWCNNVFGGRTDTIRSTTSPNWGGSFTFANCNAGHSLALQVWDQDPKNDDSLGGCTITLSSGSHSFVCTVKKNGKLRFSYTAN